MNLTINDSAPDFTAVDQNNNNHSLNDYRGQWLLLYFYPKDDTPGCTKEACTFRDNYALLQKEITILGVSADSVESHQRFSDKYHLPFSLLADPKKDMIRAYGVDGLIFSKRSSFIINPQGKIVKLYPNVDPNMHANQILQDLGDLKRLYS